MIPQTREQYSSHIPALHTLAALGRACLTSDKCIAKRGEIFSDSELQQDSVIRNFRITAIDGKNYNTKHYHLAAIISVGYKVNSERAVQFRKWATTIIQEFTIKGFTMDDERLKSDGSILSKQYFSFPCSCVGARECRQW